MIKKTLYSLTFTLVFGFGFINILSVDAAYEIIEGEIDGLKSYTIDTDNLSKEEAKKVLDNYLKEEFNTNSLSNTGDFKEKIDLKKPADTVVSPTALICNSHVSADTVIGFDSRNSNARVTNYTKGVWTATFFTCSVDTSGYTTGFWSGYTPTFADKMIFNQNYSVNAASISVTGGWGAGSYSYNASKSQGSWQSQPINSTYNHTVSKPNMTFSSSDILYSVTFTDTVDIYLPSTTYRPTASVYID